MPGLRPGLLTKLHRAPALPGLGPAGDDRLAHRHGLKARCRQRPRPRRRSASPVDGLPGGPPTANTGCRLPRGSPLCVDLPPMRPAAQPPALRPPKRGGGPKQVEFPLLTPLRPIREERIESAPGAGTSLPHTQEHLPKHIRPRPSSRMRPGHRFFVVPRKIDIRNAPASRRPAAVPDYTPPA